MFALDCCIQAGLCGFSSAQSTAAPYTIKTIIGNADRDAPLRLNVSDPLQAAIGVPYGIAQSRNGDLYIAAYSQHVIIKAEFNKEEGTFTLSSIAGTGVAGNGADNKLATETDLLTPKSVSLIESDTTGEVTSILINDHGNHRIRQLDMATGYLSSIAGTGQFGFSGDDSPAKSAKLSYPGRAYYDKSSGDIFIADTGNGRIRRIFTSNGTITTVAGKCTNKEKGGDGGPALLACVLADDFTMNDEGEWFILDIGNYFVRKVDLDGIITTVAGGYGDELNDDVATKVKLQGMTSIDVTSSMGDLLISDRYWHRIRKVNRTGYLTTIAEGPKMDFSPQAIASARDDSGGIFICDFGGRIRKMTPVQCFGVRGDNATHVCSGHGACTAENRCKCNEGWAGTDCSIPRCFGVMVTNHASVCSGHGTCVAPDHCQCDDGFMQVDCSITHCHGITSNVHSEVCSGRGQCVRRNKCRCRDGFKGHKCHRPPKM